MMSHLVEVEAGEDRRGVSRHPTLYLPLLRVEEPVLPVAGLGITHEEQLLAFEGEQDYEALVVEERVQLLGGHDSGNRLRRLKCALHGCAGNTCFVPGDRAP